MFEVFVSVKHFYVPNLKKSRDRYLSVCFLMPLRGFILAAKKVNERRSCGLCFKKKPSLDHQGTLEVPDLELCLNKLYLIPKYKYFVQWL